MYSAASIVVLALIASPAFAAPLTLTERRTISDVVSARAAPVEGFAERDVSAIKDIVQAIPSLSAEEKQAVKTALVNKISTLQDPSVVARRPRLPRPSGSGAGGGIASAVVSGAVDGLVSNVLGLVDGLFRRDDAELAARGSSRPPTSTSSGIGAAIGSAAAGGAGSAIVGNLLGQLEKLFGRDGNAKRDVDAIKDIMAAVPSLTADEKQTVKAALINKISTLQDSSVAARRIRRPRPSGSGAGGGIASAVVDGAVDGLVSNVLGLVNGLFRRDDAELAARGLLSSRQSTPASSGTSAASDLLGQLGNLFGGDDNTKRDVSAIQDIVEAIPSLTADEKQTVKTALVNKISTLQARGALGKALGGAASIAASSIVSELLDEIESRFRRSDPERLMARSEFYSINELD